jgi:hypothetical protein
MDLYHIAKFVHLLTLMVAAAITAITKFAIVRRKRARTLGEVQEWHGVLASASKVFPVLLALFVITGGYMLSFGQSSGWSTPFVVAGLTGVVLMLTNGIVLAIKGQALKVFLDNLIAKNGADSPAPHLAGPPLIAALPMINLAIAISVVFDMVTKPATIPIALTVLAVGIVLGAIVGVRMAPAPRPVGAGA